jgi:YHS domain-containing protein
MTGPTKILDPICDMIVDVAESRDQGLTMELAGREYAFCSHGCLVKFAKSPQTYVPKVDAWLVSDAHAAHHVGEPHHATSPHGDELPAIDQGIRKWYASCRCCLSEAYPKVVEQLDAEKSV